MMVITDDLVEKAARALSPNWFDPNLLPLSDGDESSIEEVRNVYRKMARATLLAVADEVGQ